MIAGGSGTNSLTNPDGCVQTRPTSDDGAVFGHDRPVGLGLRLRSSSTTGYAPGVCAYQRWTPRGECLPLRLRPASRAVAAVDGSTGVSSSSPLARADSHPSRVAGAAALLPWIGADRYDLTMRWAAHAVLVPVSSSRWPCPRGVECDCSRRRSPAATTDAMSCLSDPQEQDMINDLATLLAALTLLATVALFFVTLSRRERREEERRDRRAGIPPRPQAVHHDCVGQSVHGGRRCGVSPRRDRGRRGHPDHAAQRHRDSRISKQRYPASCRSRFRTMRWSRIFGQSAKVYSRAFGRHWNGDETPAAVHGGL